jgi:hypothetical protein
MRQVTLLVSVFALVAQLGSVSPAQAQQPRGSFEQSCRNIGVSGSLLSADCNDVRGQSHSTTIAYRQCRGDIGNNNGILTCNGAIGTEGQPGYGQRGPQGRVGPQTSGCYPGERSYDCQQRLSVQRRTHHNYVWQNGQYEDQSANGAAVAAGIFGFILNAAIVGSTSDRDYYNAHRGDPAWRTRCRGAYPSFDYNSGTYMGSDNNRHYCTR